MEKAMTTLMTRFALLGVVIWVVASAMGKRDEAKIRQHPADQKMNPDSVVWQQSGVQGPMATGYTGVI